MVSNDTAGSLLRALSRGTTRALVAVRPDIVDRRIIDGEIVWSTTRIRALEPRAVPGTRLSEIFGSQLSSVASHHVAQAAIDRPGETCLSGPIRMAHGEDVRHLNISCVYDEGLVLVEYDDRTDSIRAMDAIREGEHNFRELLEGLDAGVVLLHPDLDDDGVVVDATISWSNHASRGMWLNQEGLAPGTRVTDVYYDLVDWLAAANDAWRGTAVTRVLPPADGVAPWSSAIEILRRVGDTLVELTIDRSSDQHLLDQLAKLDHRFASLVDDLPLTVMVAPIHGVGLEFVSPNAEALTGVPLHQLQRLGQWFALIHPDDFARLQELILEVESAGFGEGRVRLRRADGAVRTVFIRAQRRTDPDGEETYVALISDVSEHHMLLERIASGERLETLGRIAGSIAHDFNNLLTIVSGNIERAKLKAGGDSIPLSTAAVAAQRAADLATSLLSFAKGRPSAPLLLDVGASLRRFETVLRGACYPKNDVVLSCPSEPVYVWADATHLEQMVLNLVTNARDASPERTPITVGVGTSSAADCHLLDDPAEGPHVTISVTDHGTGVAPELASKIWEPFFSAKVASEGSGTGLGLSTVHGLCHQHGGHVTLHSEPGRGTNVTVYLPQHTR